MGHLFEKLMRLCYFFEKSVDVFISVFQVYIVQSRLLKCTFCPSLMENRSAF